MALRMARREIGRDRLRAGFVWLMIALPVAAICAIHVVVASADISDRERALLQLGGGQAALSYVGFSATPDYDGVATVRLWDGSDARPATPVPGWGETTAEQERAVAGLAGQPALAVTWSDALSEQGSPVLILGVDLSRPDAAGVARITGGRLPADAGEVLVTPVGLVNGLPAHGTAILRDVTGALFEVTVVGTAQTSYEGVPDLVTLPEQSGDAVSAFLLTGDRPVTMADATRFAEHGFQTVSRALLEDPPPSNHQPGAAQAALFFFYAMLSAGALLEVVLVTAPAFAIGAARQRRSLALAAANGAPAAQLRRAALGQAVLLGASAAVVGTGVGAAVGAAIWPVLSADPRVQNGPLDVPVPQLAMTLVLGVLASLTAALVASRGLGRLDLVSALRGSLRPAAARRGTPGLGVVLLGAGLVLTWLTLPAGLRGGPSDGGWLFALWCAGAAGVLAGTLLLAPALFRVLAGWGSRAPVAFRLGLREAARQPGRATATVAAIMAGGVILGIVWTTVASTQADSARNYLADGPVGTARVMPRDWDRAEELLDSAAAIVAAVDPTLLAARTAVVAGWSPPGWEGDPQPLRAANPACVRESRPGQGGIEQCWEGLGSDFSSPRGSILAAPADDLIALFRLDDDQQRALRAGMLLVDDSPATPRDSRYQEASTPIEEGSILFVRLDVDADTTTTEQVPAFPVSSQVIETGATLDHYGALISTEAAATRDWSLSSWRLRVAAPDGSITPELEDRLTRALQPAGFVVEVERGWQPREDPVVWGITAALVLLAVVAAAMATVLGVAELRPFLGTFAAVGADPGLSRRLASVQAGLLGFVGTLLGGAVGLVIGAPMAMLSTRDGGPAPVLVLPWPMVLTLMAVVPLIAAGIASVSVPGRPVLTRRLA